MNINFLQKYQECVYNDNISSIFCISVSHISNFLYYRLVRPTVYLNLHSPTSWQVSQILPVWAVQQFVRSPKMIAVWKNKC